MRTRSPALRDATSSSESGVVTSLMPSRPAVTLTRACPRPDPRASPSQRHLLVPMRVALDGHRHRQGRDVTGIAQDVDTERGRVAAVALGADAQAVGALEQLVFQPSEHRIGVRTTELAEQRPFRQDRGFFKGAADADAEDQRWAGVGTGRLHALDDEVLDRGDAGRRREHRILRAVLAPAPLGHDHDLERGPRHHLHVDHGRGVVAGVHAVERRAHDGGAEVALLVALADTLVDGVLQASTGDVHFLPQLYEAHHHAGVLAVRDAPCPRQLGVVLEDLQHLLAGRRAFGAERPVERAQHVGLEADIGLHAELLDGVADGADVNVAHQPLPWLIWAMAALARSAITRGGTSSLCVARLHWLPNGSSSLPKRSPQNMSVGAMSDLQPASTARSNAASTFCRYTMSALVVPPSDVGALVVLIPGNSSLSMTTESPIRISAWPSLPPGAGMRMSSRAPNARA